MHSLTDFKNSKISKFGFIWQLIDRVIRKTNGVVLFGPPCIFAHRGRMLLYRVAQKKRQLIVDHHLRMPWPISIILILLDAIWSQFFHDTKKNKIGWDLCEWQRFYEHAKFWHKKQTKLDDKIWSRVAFLRLKLSVSVKF